MLICKILACVSFLARYRKRIAKFDFVTTSINLLNVKATIVQINLVSQCGVNGGDGAKKIELTLGYIK